MDMEKYEFAGSLFRSEKAWAMAVAQWYLTAGGWNSREDVVKALESMSPEEMAEEAIYGYGLPKERMDALVGAFVELQDNVLEYFPPEEDGHDEGDDDDVDEDSTWRPRHR